MLFGRKKRLIERLLVVEDEPLIAFDTEHILREAGYTIIATVDRVAEAVSVLESGEALDLVLVDVNLADGSGLDVARSARAAAVPVLATGRLVKPYQQRDLIGSIEAIDAALAGKRPRKLPTGFALFAVPPGEAPAA
jgi:CheY-like chemotaxis protein